MSPGAFRTVTPFCIASPERGSTIPAWPSEMATARPVGTSRRSPGARVAASEARRSSPASPGLAEAGNGSSRSSLTAEMSIRVSVSLTLDLRSLERLANVATVRRE